MAKKEQELTFIFQIIAVEIIDFNLSPCDNSLMPLNTFHFNINLNQSYIPDQKLVFVLPQVDIMHENKETKLGSMKINCIFKIEDLVNYCDSKTKKVNLPDTIVTTLNSIAISTCRGVMASHFQGTMLHNAILPLLDPKSFSHEQTAK